jgi:hypothetical protein
MSRVKFALFPLRVLAYPMRDVIVAALVVGTVAVAASVMVDSILLALSGVLYSDLLAGILVSILGFYGMKSHSKKMNQVAATKQVVADVNHHVRNALSVLAYSSHLCTDQRFCRYATDAGARIDFTLRDSLGQVRSR